MYKLLAIDLDDTLLAEDLTIPQETVAKLRALQQKGVGVTLATGRMFTSARIYALQLGLKLPLVTYNGAVVRAAASDTVFFSHLIAPEQIREVIACCKKHHWYLQLYRNDQIVVEKITAETRIDPDLKNTTALEVGDFLTAEIKPSPKMMIVEKPENIGRVTDILRQTIGDALYITGSKPYLVEMMNPNVSKAKALAELCVKLGIDRREVIAVGDSGNDLEMVEWAGLGIAVGNASDTLKNAADYISTTQRSQAICEIIDKYFK